MKDNGTYQMKRKRMDMIFHREHVTASPLWGWETKKYDSFKSAIVKAKETLAIICLWGQDSIRFNVP